MPEYCEVKFQTFCAVTKAWLKLCQVKMTNSKQWHKYTAEWVGKKKKTIKVARPSQSSNLTKIEMQTGT